MVGYIEIDIEHVRKAYRYITSDTSLDTGIQEGERAFQNVRPASDDSECIFTKQQLETMSRILEDVVYATYLSTRPSVLVELDLAGIIQDINEFYDQPVPEQVL